MSDTQRDDWPFGAELRRRRTLVGLSAKGAARRTRGVISDGRWYQLESGVQKIRGQQIPIGTTPTTVAAAAKAVDWDVAEALALAGFDPRDYREPQDSERPVLISQVSLDELLAEIKRRADVPLAARSTDPRSGKGRAEQGAADGEEDQSTGGGQ